MINLLKRFPKPNPKMTVDMKKFRYEKKSVITELNSQEVENLIKHHPCIFSEIFYERKINNIYLDSLNFENYVDNLEGVSQRIKIRVRWYGKTFGIVENPVLELKIKNNEFGKKKRYLLKSFIVDENFSLKVLQEVFSNSNLPEGVVEKLKLYSPTLLNSYKRKYFISTDKKYRVTLDKDLMFFNIKNRGNFFKHQVKNKETLIFEIKYKLKDFEGVSNITNYFPFRFIANSKYVSGIDLLNL